MGTRLSNRAERLTVIEQLLIHATLGMRAVEIAEACGVDRRTIYRDLSALKATGVPVYQKDGRFFINRRHYLANLRLNLNEAITLLMAARMLNHHQEQQNPHIVSIMRKLADLLPTLPARHTSDVAAVLKTSSVDRGYITVLETIIRGWGESRVVKLWGGRQPLDFATYLIEPAPSGEIYMVGLDQTNHQIRIIKVRRVKRAKLLINSYDIPAEFDARAYLASAWSTGEPEEANVQEVQLVFPADVIISIRSKLRGDYSLEPLSGNRFLLRMRVADWRDLLPWIRSWGAQVEVLAPEALRERLTDDALGLAAVYQVK